MLVDGFADVAGARFKIVFENRQHFLANGDSAFLVAIAAHVQHGSVHGAANVTGVGIEELVTS